MRTAKILVVLGPTASGKSALAVALAQKFGGEVVSADSRQVYRGLDIGSGKITKREMRGVPHHLLDVASPRRAFSAARYQTLARRATTGILRRGALPIICGGTGLYIDALLGEARFPAVKPNVALRRRLEKKPAEELFGELLRRDPRRAATIDHRNPRRLIRALEIIETTGKPVPPLASENPTRYDVVKIGIARPPEELKRRIAKRLAARLNQGMIAEVKQLRADGLSWKRLDDLGLEYRFVSHYLRKIITKKEMIAAIEQESWHYAKRQKQWWKKDSAIHWITKGKEAEQLVRTFLKNSSTLL